jgi:hypothetical protein
MPQRLISAISLFVIAMAITWVVTHRSSDSVTADVRRMSADRDTMGVVEGVAVFRSGYGSAVSYAGDGATFYFLSDRGPNIDAADGNKAFPFPAYAPRIVKGTVSGGTLAITGEIALRKADGSPMSGIPAAPGTCGATGEAAFTLDGTPITPDPRGLDSEGLVALSDGTFWVSDEYGPHLVHFGSDGKEIERRSPCAGGLPPVYAKRRPNRGMEGLTVTPDGRWLVGMMQAPLENPSPDGVRDISRLVRILFVDIATNATREYAYLLDDPGIEGISEILALAETRFLVLERDARFVNGTPRSAIKRIYEADVSHATEISAAGELGVTPVAGSKTLEQASVEELAAAGIVTAKKTLRLDLLALGFPHDKAEGMAVGPGGFLVVTNDDDFGIVSGDGMKIAPKVLPSTSVTDFVELWQFHFKPAR